MFTATVPDAAAMTADALRASVCLAYEQLGIEVRSAGQSPIRLWNYMPDPAEVMGPPAGTMAISSGKDTGPPPVRSQQRPASASSAATARFIV
jgi:hypothetical protein